MGLVPDENPQQLTDLHSPSKIIKQITSISTEQGVEVEVTTADA
jgi:ribosomal protein S10